MLQGLFYMASLPLVAHNHADGAVPGLVLWHLCRRSSQSMPMVPMLRANTMASLPLVAPPNQYRRCRCFRAVPSLHTGSTINAGIADFEAGSYGICR